MDERPGISRPRAEPEIIPPGDQPARWEDSDGAAPRIHVVRMGPVGVFALLLIVALLAAVFAVVLVGAFLIAIPIAGLLLAVAIVSSLWRGSRRRGA
jgi:hypothetical protein